MVNNITVAALGKELGVGINVVFKMAAAVGVRVTRGAAELTPSQAGNIRDHCRRDMERRVRAAASPPARPSVRVTTAQTIVRTTQAPRTVGPPRACACCGLRLPGYAPLPNDDVDPSRCGICCSHYAFPGEGDGRTLSRLQDHDSRLRHAYAVTWSREAEAEDKMRGAYRSRDNWRGTLVDVMDLHAEAGTGRCGCGAKAFPCATWKALERANRGILRQVEAFLSLQDDERGRRLYGNDQWEHDVA